MTQPHLYLGPEPDIAYSWPRPPRAIMCGESVVGYLHDDRRGEYVTAVAGDPEVEAVLYQWWRRYQATKAAERALKHAEWEAECRARDEERRKRARKALGLSTQEPPA